MPTSPTGGDKTRSAANTTRRANGTRRANSSGALTPESSGNFVLPLVHFAIPETAVSLAFWGALAGSAALGAVDLPLAALIGAGVVVARHRHRA